MSTTEVWSTAKVTDRCVLVLDVGTSSLKAVAFGPEGQVLARRAVDYPVQSPRPGWAEQNAEDWWVGGRASIRELVEELRGCEVAAITVTNQQVTTVPVDTAGKPLDQAILWMDTRTAPLVRQLRETLGAEAVLDEVGIPLSTSWAAVRPLWWKVERPEIYSEVDAFLSVDAFMYKRLTGYAVSDESNACFGPFSIRDRRWSASLIESLGLNMSTFPEVVAPGSVIGTITDEVAEGVGLPKTTKVVAGASDQPSSAIGLGALGRGQVEATTGTGTFVIAHTGTPHPTPRLMTNCAGVPGQWLVYGVHYVSGAVMTWFAEQFFPQQPGKRELYEQVVLEASQVEPASEGLVILPYFQGARTPYFDDSARGVVYGLTLSHTRGHLARAIIESNAYGIRQVLETFQEVGIEANELRIAGGGTSSDFACQIQADVTGCVTIRPEVQESTALGAALLAWVGVGEHASLHEAVEASRGKEDRFLPNPSNRAVYDRAYRRYVELYPSLRRHFSEDSRMEGI
jgi:xylulokinase